MKEQRLKVKHDENISNKQESNNLNYSDPNKRRGKDLSRKKQCRA